METKIKHLEFIQTTIARMASNSFAMKGWMIAILAALLALYANSDPKNEYYLIIAAISTILFWVLDSYYLYIEQNYRTLYKDIVNNNNDIPTFDMSIERYKNWKKFMKAMFCSCSTWLMYLPITVTLIGFYITLK